MKPTRKLQLNRESLHELTNEDLALIVGGADVSLVSCGGITCVTDGCTTWCPSNDFHCPTDFCTDNGCTYRTLCDPHM